MVRKTATTEEGWRTIETYRDPRIFHMPNYRHGMVHMARTFAYYWHHRNLPASHNRSQLLSLSMRHHKVLQQIAKEKEALHEAVAGKADALRVSEARRRAAERRVKQLEKALRAVHELTSSSGGLGVLGLRATDADDAGAEESDGDGAEARWFE